MNPNPLKNNPKLFPSLASAVERRAALKAQGKKLVLTNGCFDLLHCGHVSYLQEAAKLIETYLLKTEIDAVIAELHKMETEE